MEFQDVLEKILKLHFIVLKRNIFKKEENDLFNFSKNMNVDPCIDDLWKASAA